MALAVHYVGAGEGNRTLMTSLEDCGAKPAKSLKSTCCGDTKKALSWQLAVLHDKSANSPSAVNLFELSLPSDLVILAAAWPSIPDAIRQALMAIVAPYIKEGEK